MPVSNAANSAPRSSSRVQDRGVAGPVRVCRILLSVSEASGPYNQFSRPFADTQAITLVLKDKPQIDVPADIEVVHAGGSFPRFLGNILSAAASRFDAFHLHHCNLVLVAPLIRLLRLRRPGQIVFTLGTCYENLRPHHRVFAFVAGLALDHFVCCGKAVRSSLPGSLVRLLGRRLTLIRHGIDVTRLPTGAQANRRDAIVATRLIRRKHVDTLVRGLARAGTGLTLEIAGRGPERAALEALAASLADKARVRFLGMLSRDDLLRRFARRRFCVSASTTDGIPIAVLEASGSGCIPVLAATAPHEELREAGLEAFSFRIGDPRSFADELRRAAKLSDAEYRRLATRNREVVGSFGAKEMMRRYEELYRPDRSP